MTEIVVFTEEPSARIIGESLVETLGYGRRTLVLQHDGKSNLERSFPRKIENWASPEPPRFVVLRDNDGGDCKTLKARLLTLTPRRVVARVKIRIVMQELESWYLGDLDALWRAGLIAREVAEAQRRKAILKNPDAIQNAKVFLKTKIVAGGQIELARRIGPHLKIADNRSRSFHAFVGALRWAAGESDSP